MCMFSEFWVLLSTLWLQTEKAKGELLQVRTQNIRGSPEFLIKVGGISFFEPRSGPNLALFETPILDV